MILYPTLKLRCPFEITEIGGESIAVGLEDGSNTFHGIIKLENDSALFMFKKLKDGISLPELIMECMKEYDGSPVEEVGPKVLEFLDKLKEQGLLVADTTSGIKVEDKKNDEN